MMDILGVPLWVHVVVGVVGWGGIAALHGRDVAIRLFSVALTAFLVVVAFGLAVFALVGWL